MATSFPGSLSYSSMQIVRGKFCARALRRMLCCLGNRVNLDTCRIRVDGQIRYIYGYVWTWKSLIPERKSCGFLNIRIRVGQYGTKIKGSNKKNVTLFSSMTDRSLFWCFFYLAGDVFAVVSSLHTQF